MSYHGPGGAEGTRRHVYTRAARRARPPHRRALRAVLMPGTRVAIAQRLVLQLVHLSEELDSDLVGVAMIDRDVVADDVTAGTPDQMDVVLGEPLAGALDFRP